MTTSTSRPACSVNARGNCREEEESKAATVAEGSDDGNGSSKVPRPRRRRPSAGARKPHAAAYAIVMTRLANCSQ
jgi:hypothetical protein